jgi:hypothetical protein
VGLQHFVWTGDRRDMTRQLVMTAIAVMTALGLSACSDFRRSIGEEKSKPDEFQVVVRPPLSLPPGFSETADNIIEKTETSKGDAQSQTAELLGANNVENSGFTGLFDFSSVPDDIRTKVDEETYGVQLEKRLPLQILFGGLPDVGPVLDKMAEDSRLRKNRAKELAPTEGGTKAIDPTSDQPLNIN